MRYVAVLAAFLTVTVAAACNGDDDTAQAPATTTAPAETPTPTPTPTPEPTPTPSRTTPTPKTSGPLRIKKGQTRPGAQLRFGQRAVVPIRDRASYSGNERDGVVGIVVGTIRTTAGRNVQGNFDERSRKLLAQSTAYYAPITITNLSGDDLSIITNPSFDGRRRGGASPDVALIGGSLPGCTSDPSPDTFDHKGAVWKTCVIAVSRSSRIREVHYRNAPYGTETQIFDDPPPKYNQYYGLGDVVWH